MSGDGRITAARVRLADVDFHPHNVRADLGDLRSLIESMRELGLQQPVVLERRGSRLRIRAGHRRVAAAKHLKWATIPALVHDTALGDDDWLVAAVHENTRRKDLGHEDRRRAVLAMREQDFSWQAIAETFDASLPAVKRWADDSAPAPAPRRAGKGPAPFVHRKRLTAWAAAWTEHAQQHDVTVEQLLHALAALAAGQPEDATLPRLEQP